MLMEIHLAKMDPGLLSFRCRGALLQLNMGHSADPLKAFISNCSWEGKVLLDLRGVDAIGTESIAWLIHWHNWITKSGGVLGLCSLPPRFKDFFAMCHVQDLIPIWENETEARKALASLPARSAKSLCPPLGIGQDVKTHPTEKKDVIPLPSPSPAVSTKPVPLSPIAGRISQKIVEILVVDDSAVERRRAADALEKCSGLSLGEDFTPHVLFASNGIEALEIIQQKRPHLVVTDLIMPELDGLGLVKEIRFDYPSIPVVLMTAHGSEEIAATALRTGAASYVPKKYLARDLAETVVNILDLARADREQLIFPYLTVSDFSFSLATNLALVSPLVTFLRGHLERLQLCHVVDELRAAIALREALMNAFTHGNLELSSDLRESDPESYLRCLSERQQQSPYKDRHVHVTVCGTRQQVVYTIRDEGAGFDTRTLPDPTDVENIKKPTGRGVYLIRHFMDEVRFNDLGNELTLIKRGAG
jgi:CheY-like chemotaxis protein